MTAEDWHSCRMVKKSVQQGRSESKRARRTLRYVEPLTSENDAGGLFHHPARGGRAFGGTLCRSQGPVSQKAVPAPAAIVQRICQSDPIRD